MDKDLPSVLEAQKKRLPEYARRRAKLILPEPQISDREIHLISNMGVSVEEGGSDATNMLISDYLPTPTPGRDLLATPTPQRVVERTPLRPDTITMEAQNLRALKEASTPLLPGENTELHPTDFSGAKPKIQDIRTPNPLLTPLRSDATPSTGLTPGRTPMRDSLSINENEQLSSLMEERMRLAQQRDGLKSRFGSLPEPQREIKIAMPDVPDDLEEYISDVEGGTATFLVDADDVDRKALLAAQKRKEKRVNMKSKVLNRELPRPYRVRTSYSKNESEIEAMKRDPQISDLDICNEMIKNEMIKVITNDALSYPTNKARPPKINKRTWNYDYYSDAEMRKAKSLIDKEIEKMNIRNGQINFEEYIKVWESCNEDLLYIPQKDSFNLNSISMSLDDRLGSMEYLIDTISMDIKREERQIQKLEKKLAVTQGGYIRKLAILEKEIQDLQENISKKSIELECFQALHDCEMRAIPSRIAKSTSDLDRAREIEREYQSRFANLSLRKNQLLTQLQQE